MTIQYLFLTTSKIYFLFIFSTLTAYSQDPAVTGEKKANHKLTFTWEGPSVDESSSTFKDYRLDVTFTSPGKNEYVVPGYFAADGNAGESGATSGNKWRAHFVPIETGEWHYEVDFRTGPNIAVNTSPGSGTATAFNGTTGSFTVDDTDKTGADFRGKGKLQYKGEHFLRFSGGEYFLKVGANSPEVFLEYADFDGTATSRNYSAHESHWSSGDPSWKNGMGKGIIGVVNYLSEQGINSHYFLLMNAYGDGKQAFPWTGADNYYNYDVSKLDQWQIVFDHMMKKGIMPHFVLSEQENQSYFEFKEGGVFADSRKVYYREMVARFGYLNASTWNIGEESGWENDDTYGKGNTTAQRKEFAEYLQGLFPYGDHVVVHNGPSDTDDIFSELVGDENYTGISYQGNFENPYYGHERIAYWIKESAASGHKWVVSYDEPYTGPEKPDMDIWRKNAVWASLLAGGAGVEFYIGAGKDITIQDYSLYKEYWAILKNAHSFFVGNQLPFYQMVSSDELTTQGWCLAKPGEVYVVYLPDGGSANLTLDEGNYTVKWFDPREGGDLKNGSVTSLSGPGAKSLGIAPSDSGEDWVILVRRISE